MMDPRSAGQPRRILIASTNPLFAKGLQRLYESRTDPPSRVVGITRTMEDTFKAMDDLHPDLIIVDHDDVTINQKEFLSHFVGGDRPMQVMLVSLRGSGEVVVYDRQTLSPSQAEEQLKSLWPMPQSAEEKTSPRDGNMRHLVSAGILVVLSTVLVYLGLSRTNLLPVNASVQAGPIDNLFNLHFIFIAFLFALIVVFMLYSVFIFRRKPGDETDAVHITGNNKLEAIWTIIPLIVVLTVAYIGALNLGETIRNDPDAMVINVTAGQWFWSFEYPEQGIVSPDLVLPVNRQVLLRMTSRDVIHSFWVPEFRVKQDVLPGENLIKELRITPSRVGEYKVRCAEMCGVSHAYMESPVIVMEQEDYDAWLAEQSGQLMQDPVARGEKIARDNGCLACHSVDGTPGVGPTWAGLYESSVPLADGTTVKAEETYLFLSITDPAAQVVEGYPGNVMPPNYDEILADEQIRDLIMFIESLK